MVGEGQFRALTRQGRLRACFHISLFLPPCLPTLMLISFKVLLLFFIRLSFFCRWYSSRRAFMSLQTQGSEAVVTASVDRRESWERRISTW